LVWTDEGARSRSAPDPAALARLQRRRSVAAGIEPPLTQPGDTPALEAPDEENANEEE
jgi:hypothetical protein